jgi:hypothetical protein
MESLWKVFPKNRDCQNEYEHARLQSDQNPKKIQKERTLLIYQEV